MSSRLPIVLGLLLGAMVAVGLIAGAAYVAPDAAVPTHSANVFVPSFGPPSPSIVVSGSPGASGSPIVTSSAPSGSAAVSPGSSAGNSSSGVAANFHVGQAAPPLVVPQVGGGTIDLAKLKGKPVWINFMATWCPSCRDEFPLMNRFAARYGANGLVVMAVDVREDEGAVATFGQSVNATFPIGLDGDGAAQATWGAYALPVHYWIDARGIVRDGSLGGIGPDVMAKGLESIMPGVHVTP